LPDRLVTELMAHRTLALRDALAEHPAITFQAVLHNFVLATFYRFASARTCLRSDFTRRPFPPKLQV
jgi:ParB family transcriptional regulator, chromosome partitioning protein